MISGQSDGNRGFANNFEDISRNCQRATIASEEPDHLSLRKFSNSDFTAEVKQKNTKDVIRAAIDKVEFSTKHT
jgi:hypothetical protein